MKYLSLDIETTGIDPKSDQILEVAAVVENYNPRQKKRAVRKNKPVEKLPAFHCYIKPEDGKLHGSPYALSMHQRIFKILADPDTADAPVYYIDDMYISLYRFIKKHFGIETVTLAGKNVISFDVAFLKAVYKSHARKLLRSSPKSEFMYIPFGTHFRFRHRALDPGSMYVLPEDSAPPDTITCLRRAGLVPTALHTALGDAQDIIRLIRYNFLLQSGMG